MAETAEIRLLGELEVVRRGRPEPLPASKKTRALLGYLAVTGRAHTRERLCDLLWQGPDDPRAALRWSLAKLRPVLGPDALDADREKIVLRRLSTDLDAVRETVASGVDGVPMDVLVATAERFRGELLEGLALPDCYRYHEWLVAEREAARALRVSIVQALVDRHSSSNEGALRWARELVALDPLSEAAHVRIIRLLGELGRRKEALSQFETCRRILAEELGAKPSPALLEARMKLASPDRSAADGASERREAPSDRPANPERTAHDPGILPLIGRENEMRAALEAFERAGRAEEPRVLVVLGEPGIGKSRLLTEIATRAASGGGTVLSGMAYEAERVRPYGPWIDALRAIPKGDVPESLRTGLAALVPELGDGAEPRDRASMFDAVARLLVRLSEARGPVAVFLDDVHWLDEASAGLFHYVARALHGTRVFLGCGARSGELSDNVAALRLVRALAREHRSETLQLGPLAEAATMTLSGAAAPAADRDRVVRESGGNPLFVVELSRALERNAGTMWESIGGLIAERLATLDAPALDLASWAAALGKRFDLATLERVTETSPVDLLARVGELERHGVVRAAADGAGYDFAHDLVRTGAYRRLSEPTRRVVHRRIARTLDDLRKSDAALAGDVVHHAELAGDAALVARAAVSAAQRCVRMFAGAEATRFAEIGLGALDGLPQEERLTTELALLEVLVYAGTSVTKPHRLKSDLTRTVAEAEDSGQSGVAAKALHALSVLQFDGGDLIGAHSSTLRAADAARSADPLARARQLGGSARCLGMLERDVDQAQAMMAEANRIAEDFGTDFLELRWGAGLLKVFSGDVEEGARDLRRALELARSTEDRWAEYEGLRALVQLEIENGTPSDLCADLLAVAEKMSEGTELASARALEALVRLARGDPAANDAIERSLATLQDVDAKGMSAYVLNIAAEHDLRIGRLESAEHRASEALRAATAVNRQSQMAIARAVLGRVALASGDFRGANRHFDAIRPELERKHALSARARKAAADLDAALGRR